MAPGRGRLTTAASTASTACRRATTSCPWVFLGVGVGNYRQTFHPSVTDQARATPVKVAMGEETTSIDIQLGRPEKEHLISGRVVDEPHLASLYPVGLIGYRANIPAGGVSQGLLQSDSQGRFEIKNCYQGSYVLQATSI